MTTLLYHLFSCATVSTLTIEYGAILWRTRPYNQYIQISKLFFNEKCDQVVMNLLAATDVGMFLPKPMKEQEEGQVE
jgi:hypothetical protein